MDRSAEVKEDPGRSWPYTAAWDAGIIDTHCRLQSVFDLTGHEGTFAEFRLTRRHSFPYCYGGCVASFSVPACAGHVARWEALLEEDFLWGCFGCPPHRAVEYNEYVDTWLARTLGRDGVVAVGNIGLDFSSKDPAGGAYKQRLAFRRQLALASAHRLPVVISSRDPTQETVRIIKETVGVDHPIHLQGFTGGWLEAKFWYETFHRLYIGLTPALGLPGNERLVEVARNVPLDRVLFETDSPDFLPAQEVARLPCSHPGIVVHVAHLLSAIRGLPVEDVVDIVRQNTRRVYGI